MLALLNPRLWLALGIAAVLAFSHFTAYRSGKSHVRTEWDLAKATANTEARRMEQSRQSRADEAARSAVSRQAGLSADAARARAAADGLRDELDATRLYAAQSLDAATKSVAALSDVFQQCSRRYSELAEIADRHASDSLMYQQAWPR